MATYPKTIKHSSGRKMQIRNDLLAIRISPRLNEEEKDKFLKQLEAEIGAESIAIENERPLVSGTSFTWIKPNGIDIQEFPQELNLSLLDKYPDQIDNVAPVYQFDQLKGIENSTTIRSDMLLVRFGDHLTEKEVSQLSGRLEEFELRFDKEASLYQGKYNIFRTNSPFNDVFQIKNTLEDEVDGVHTVDFNYQPIFDPNSFQPSDPEYHHQWNMWLIEAGDEFAATPTTSTGWDITTGDPSIIVAVIDSGVFYSHPDLQHNIFESTNGVQTTRGFLVDEDGIVYSEFSPVPNNAAHQHILDHITASNGGPLLNSSGGARRHGTNVAGIIAAGITAPSTPGGIGIAGLAGGCKILPIARLGDSSACLNAAINKAVEEGVKVINISAEDTGWQTVYLDDTICKVVGEENVVIVASSGNVRSSDPETTIGYPALHSLVIAVGASTEPDASDGDKEIKRSDSRYLEGGNPANGVSVVAPGDDIRTTTFGVNDYTEFSRTSAAAPHVAGLAALMLSKNPNQSAFEVRDIIERCAVKISATDPYDYRTYDGFSLSKTWDEKVGHGRINVLHSLDEVPEPPSPKTEILDIIDEIPLDQDRIIFKKKEDKETSKDSFEVSQLTDAVRPLANSIDELQIRINQLEQERGIGSAFIDENKRPDINPNPSKE